MPRDHIDLKINGEPFSLETPPDIRRFQRYLEKLLEWFNAAPEFSKISLEEELKGNASNGASNGKKPVKTPPIGKRTIDYILRAVEARGGRATVDQVFHDVRAQGWSTTSTDEQIMLVNIRTTAYHKRYRHWLTHEGDLLILTQEGREHARRLQQELGHPIRVSDGEDFDWEDSEGNKYRGPQLHA